MTDFMHGQQKEEKKPIGRILSGTLRTARVEFTGDWRGEMGSLVSFEHGGVTQYARVDRLESHRYAGLTGYVYFLEPLERPPRNLVDIFDADDDMENGVLFIGQDRSGYDIRIHVNPLFDHTLVCGMTRAGKTHFCIVLLEETIMQRMPALVIDSHGEFVNLAKRTDEWQYTEDVVVVEDLRIEDLISSTEKDGNLQPPRTPETEQSQQGLRDPDPVERGEGERLRSSRESGAPAEDPARVDSARRS